MNARVLKVRVELPLEELIALEGALKDAAVNPEQVGKALAAAGALLRRMEIARAERARIEALLRRLPSKAVHGWSASVELAGVEARMRRATEEAVEAALPEATDEGGTWAAWAREGIEAREVLESQLWALAARERLGFEDDAPARVRLREALTHQDRALAPRARWLVGVNPWRRDERDLLDAEHRATAWWFTARAECDALLPALAGEVKASAHLQSCELCQRDLQTARPVDVPRQRHLSEDDLWRFDLGLSTAAERAFIDQHLRTCPACAQDVAALEDGEDTLRALTAPTQAPTATVVDIRTRMRPSSEPEVVADTAHFRLLLFRREAPRLVVQPKGPRKLAAAALLVQGQPHRTIAARAGAEGLGFEVGNLTGALRVRARFAGSDDDVECDVDL